MDITVNRAIRRLHNEVRRAVGLPATSELGKDPALARQLVLCQGMPELEPARPDLPEHLHHVGDAAAGTRTVEPARVGWSSPSRPVVPVSEGTLGRCHDSLVTRTLAGYAIRSGWVAADMSLTATSGPTRAREQLSPYRDR
ncbi:hypothetical protein [Kocuria sp. cx-455]|uniref:hypothetical protein n=1 Tax=Kocuria sp. cx-455 TaxID=2771377 RepID=UPI003D7050F3